MSKFIKGDLVRAEGLFDDTPTLGLVNESWSSHISKRTGIPLVKVLLLEEGVFVFLDEDEVELALDEYEFMAVEVDQEDFEQTSLGSGYEWGTLEEAEKLIRRTLEQEDDEAYKANHQLQINRRRKAGYTVGYKAFRW